MDEGEQVGQLVPQRLHLHAVRGHGGRDDPGPYPFGDQLIDELGQRSRLTGHGHQPGAVHPGNLQPGTVQPGADLLLGQGYRGDRPVADQLVGEDLRPDHDQPGGVLKAEHPGHARGGDLPL